MHGSLRRALAIVLADLRRIGAPEPELREGEWSDTPHQRTAMLVSAEGQGQGVSLMTTDSPAAQLASVADQVQEWVVERCWELGLPTNVPPCRAHPARHPLTAAMVEGVALWRCPVDGAVAIRVGRLGLEG